ncbi:MULTISPECIES: dTMP kinase [unclassified Solwaraspora]|uniref:dTMP kinase n=1 Tax=unclassified Solwaraspora TaxID=2627926 RepID=UPI00248AEC2C|nr:MULTISPECIES: dTMP kinase [unclassified Solwaraspora]WBB97464.1 dTMP kinase [Solwaraspora sp. WMMA2059]WBC18643.1 dTMP kinase [Solwaraspora sp. WMMA2080]WJK33948.1 dTMP kinase [Solwaraspora sp. WMMA2065]
MGGSGLLVTIDGQSGVGKTTAARLLHEQLRAQGRRVLLTRTPSDSEIGSLARAGTFTYRAWELALLVAADRYHHERSVLRPAVADGAIVICDRYLASSLVLDPLDGVAPDLVRAIYRHLPAPDIAVILSGDPEVCARRAAARGHYSRFHTPDPAANRRERAGFVAAAEALRRAGHPVLTYDIGTDTADAVTRQLAGLIVDRTGDR